MWCWPRKTRPWRGKSAAGISNCGAVPRFFLLRALSDCPTDVDGVPAPKGLDVPIAVGSRIDVANALSLVLMAPQQLDAGTQLSVARQR
ncbi:hypothetical protein [Roseateles sp.]|uniref:hypothetical protein n=1 Tax=Roseateles sp. TaxID=1971397 RepID=UPI00286C3A08|nr:hypothetical protein [Roseateles sp.]